MSDDKKELQEKLEELCLQMREHGFPNGRRCVCCDEYIHKSWCQLYNAYKEACKVFEMEPELPGEWAVKQRYKNPPQRK